MRSGGPWRFHTDQEYLFKRAFRPGWCQGLQYNILRGGPRPGPLLASVQTSSEFSRQPRILRCHVDIEWSSRTGASPQVMRDRTDWQGRTAEQTKEVGRGTTKVRNN